MNKFSCNSFFLSIDYTEAARCCGIISPQHRRSLHDHDTIWCVVMYHVRDLHSVENVSTLWWPPSSQSSHSNIKGIANTATEIRFHLPVREHQWCRHRAANRWPSSSYPWPSSSYLFPRALPVLDMTSSRMQGA